MTFAIADLFDEHGDTLRIVEPMFADFGGELAFTGPISTIKAHEDNTLVRAALEEPGENRVLVVDGGGSLRCAMLGDNLAQLGIDNGWAGIIVYGCIRDSKDIAEMAIGVKALATHPAKSKKQNRGDRDITVTFGGVSFVPGETVYADLDGIAVSEQNLLA